MYVAPWCHKGLDKWDEVKSTNTVNKEKKDKLDVEITFISRRSTD